MTRYYFAGAYARRAELNGYAERLDASGTGAMSCARWLWMDQDADGAGLSAGEMETPGEIARGWRYAQRDIEDLSVAQVIVSFTGEGARGGRHVEFGVGLDRVFSDGWNATAEIPRMVVVGPREHVFHCHPLVEVYPDFDAFLDHEIKENG